eukprot:14335971-Ditylum_brightwellii.AAC.1
MILQMNYCSVAFAIVSIVGILRECQALEIGATVCAKGFIMDKFCIKRGTLLDKPSVKTLRNPKQHSLHSLVDDPRCVNSGYEVLLDPPSPGEGGLYRRAWTLDAAGAKEMIALARAT